MCYRLFLDSESVRSRVIFLVQISERLRRGTTLDVLCPICTALLVAYQTGWLFAGDQSVPKPPR